MRELAKSIFSIFWSAWVGGMRQATAAIYQADEVDATFDALYHAGENIQRGAVDLVAGLMTGAGGDRSCTCEQRDTVAWRDDDIRCGSATGEYF